MKTNKETLIFYILLTLASVRGASAQTPPANDNFANRTLVAGSAVTFGGSLYGATLETPETISSNACAWVVFQSNGSAWWTWTAPASSAVVVRMTGTPTSNLRYAFYTGTNLNSLAMVSWDSPLMKPSGRYARFNAVGGTAYQIQVLGFKTNIQPFSVQIVATNPPLFLAQPQDCTVSPYGSAFFSALATGPAPPAQYKTSTSYQWLFNGVPIPGQTFPSLLVHGVTTNQAGTYSVIASNVGGVTQGGSASLTVTDTNPVPTLAALPPANSNSLNFTLTGEPGRWHKVESSTNLRDWANPLWLQLSNATATVSLQRLAPNHFVRASLDVPTEVCVAQLKQLQWAANLSAIENHTYDGGSIFIENLKPYVP